MFNRALRPVAQITRNGVRTYHGETKPFKYPTMNECPVPQGSWQEYYDKKQKLYNKQLVGGVVFFFVALGIARASGALYGNMSPKLPEGYVAPNYYD